MMLEIVNGRVLDPANDIDRVVDVFVDNGRIAGIGHAPDGFAASVTLDASGRIVMPGLVDLCARLRESGQEHKATIASETQAAASAGITSIACPPDTDPVIDSPAQIQLIRQKAVLTGVCRVHAIGALTRGLDGESLSEMGALKLAGCVGVGNVLRPMASSLVLRRAMEYAATMGLTIHLHPMDFDLMNNGCAHEGALATRMGLPGIPSAAETAAVGQILALVEQTGGRVHFCRLSTARAARMVARARFDGLPVTADVCGHQLFLTEMDINDFNSLCHTLPPLRTQRDLEGLRDAVASGVISAVCSDHQPHEDDAKRAPFPQTEPGISAVETLMPLMLRLVEEGTLSLPEAIARVTTGPATILGLEAGSLSPGAPADICILDPEFEWELSPERLRSQGRNSPFSGWTFSGRVTHTLLDGRVVYEVT